jgi:Ca2+-binding EF-hand superfamily protein
MAFGITKANLRAIITSCSFADGKDFTPLIDQTWKSLNPDGAELIDALGAISAFLIVSQGTFNAKAKALFDVFDFNGNGTISQDELTILVMASVLGVLRFFFSKVPIPSDARFEEFTVKALADVDTSGSGTISKSEFLKFASTVGGRAVPCCRLGCGCRKWGCGASFLVLVVCAPVSSESVVCVVCWLCGNRVCPGRSWTRTAAAPSPLRSSCPTLTSSWRVRVAPLPCCPAVQCSRWVASV